MRKKFIVLLSIVTAVVVIAQTNLKIRYWFDNDFSNVRTVESSKKQIHIDADVSESLEFNVLRTDNLQNPDFIVAVLLNNSSI